MCDTLKDKYQLLEEIGRGRFGTIYRCFCPLRNSYFACKIIDKTVLTDPIDQQCIENEPKIMTLLYPHPYILSIIDVIETPETLSLFIELCQTQTLYDKIVHQRSFPEREAASCMKQLLTAVSHCHRLGVIHRDLKPDNVLLDNRNNIKLSDFGSAVYLDLERENGNSGVGVEGVVGTPYYVAPEVLMGKEYNEKVDIWSCGVILYIMICGVPPFYGECVEEVFEKVLRGNLRFPPKLFRSVSSEVKDLLRKMICRDVGRRLSAEQALRHPWILNGGVTNAMVDLT